MVSRRAVLTTGLGVATGLVATGCGAAGSSRASWRKPSPSPTSKVRVTTSPAAATKDILPTEPIVVSAEDGMIQTVTVTGGETAVAGALDADQRTWRSTGSLDYATTYTVTVTAVDDKGLPVEHTSTFDTVVPAAVASVTFQANALVALRTGSTYGVGQPVIVYFGKPVTDRAAAEQAMEVVTQPAVEGRWRWIGQAAHWRPAKYWTPGTKITVRVNVLGVHLGDGVYGGGNHTANFTIGQSRIAVADGASHRMQVYIDGAKVRDIPVSLGKDGSTKGADGQTIHFATNSGPHVVLAKNATVRMRSSTFGITDPKDPNYYDETIKLCSRISYSGEFVHLADWNIPAHGNTNTSHGCINVGPADAQWFYDTFQIGDVVEVKNTSRQLSLTDGLGDWTVPWAQW